MSGAATPVGLEVERLGLVLAEVRRHLAPALATSRHARLEHVFAALRPHLAATRAEEGRRPPTSTLQAESLSPLLGSLGVALEAARQGGALMNVWATAGLKRDEVRNAGVLASLFDPRVAGDRAVPFLAAFLNEVEGRDRGLLPSVEDLARGYWVQTEACPLGALDDRVDLSIEGPDFLLLIEVKIDAAEGPAQLSRYDRVLQLKAQALGKRAALVYLSPAPAREPPPDAFYADWGTVRRAARRIASARPGSQRTFHDHLLAQFAEHVRNF